MKLGRLLCLALAAVLLASSAAYAQGNQTGVISGETRTPDTFLLPGVTVTVSSSALQGTRQATTDEAGAYAIRGLPPGDYRVTFTMQGMQSVEQTIQLPLGRTVDVDATLALATVQEVIDVRTETSPALLVNPSIGANYETEEIDMLATPRTLAGIAELAPGLTDNTPNADQVTISGATAFDNVFLVDGVDINDNLFGSPNDLFIEDAIQETQVLTSGISAEYGRFSGGVINAVTKHGGNTFSGSFRFNLQNPSWKDEVPFEVENDIEHDDRNAETYEGTIGGPILIDRLWFFGAGRWQDIITSDVFAETGLPYNAKRENRRWEAKLTGTIADNHTLQGSYLWNRSIDLGRRSFTFSIDPNTQEDRELPNDLFVINYNGVLTSRLFVNGQYSQKQFGFRGSGGGDTNIINSPFFSLAEQWHYNSPYFDETDPEDRDNRQIAGSVSYFMTSPTMGRHDLKGGFEHYTSTNRGGNSQSPTGYVFDAEYVTNPDGSPFIDANGRIVPTFVSGENFIENWLPVKGAKIDIRTLSLYVHDRWSAGTHWAFDLGARYERVRSEATGGIIGADTDTIVPRLAATYDWFGDGRFILQSTYGHYAGKYSENHFASTTNVGTPNALFGVYVGPLGQGRDFAAGFDPDNYVTFTGTFPLANVFLEDGLHSPVTREFTLSGGGEIGPRGYAKATYIWRKADGFIEDQISTETGFTDVVEAGLEIGTFTNQVYVNEDFAERNYQALLFQSNYRFNDRFSVNGHWTVQLKNEGNYEGEASNQPGIPSLISDYPEIFTAARNFPFGRFDDYQQHKIRLWAIYTQPLGRAGDLTVGPIFRYNSALTYSLRSLNQPITDTQLDILAAAGYPDAPLSQTVYYAQGRGSEEFSGYGVIDLAVNYDVPIWRELRPWVKFEMYNMFNNDNLIGHNTVVLQDPNSPVDQFGLRTGFVRGSNFGKGTALLNYPDAREWRIAFGIRF